MDEIYVKKALSQKLNFSSNSIKILDIYVENLLKYNKKLNLIGKSTENKIWSRHILDSAQIVPFIEFKRNASLADLGSGAGLPGIILAIFNKNPSFHVKLYEKSPLKANFLTKMGEILNLNIEVINKDINHCLISSDYIVSRAFKKLPKILEISRENSKRTHKLIILKGKSAQAEINNASKGSMFKYKLESSITDKESKIIILDANKSE